MANTLVKIPDSKLVDKAIKVIENAIEKKEQSEYNILKVLTIINSLGNETFSIEQAEMLLSIYQDFRRIPVSDGERNKSMVYREIQCKRLIVRKLCESVWYIAEATEDVQVLRQLINRLPYRIEKMNPVIVTPTKLKITSKISNIESNKAFNKAKSVFSDNIVGIVNNLTSDCIDSDVINKLVNDEISSNIKGKAEDIKMKKQEPKQIRKQVFYKVFTLLEKTAQERPIKNPEKVIEVLGQQFDTGLDLNVMMVVKCLMARNELSLAMEICNQYKMDMDDGSAEKKSLSKLQKEIVKAEIGQIILKGIRADATEEQQNSFYDMIEKKMHEYRIDYKTIPLGYSKDGQRKISLGDVCDDMKFIER